MNGKPVSCFTVDSALDTAGAVVVVDGALVAATVWTGGVIAVVVTGVVVVVDAAADVIADCTGADVVVGAATTLLVGAFTICWVRTT